VFRWEGEEGWLNQHIFKVTPREGISVEFLFFLLKWLKPRFAEIARNKQTTGLGHVTIQDLKRMQVAVPEFDEQSAIVETIGPIQEKIELNRWMNETLEAMARAIFKDWFVDFGPTRAKMAGQAPYLAPDLWSLFPARLDDDGKPEGWDSGTLGDVAQQAGVSISPEALDPDTPYIGLEHMPRRSIALSDWEGAGKVTSGKLSFRKGDFLFGKLRPYFHKVGIAPVDGICSTDIVVIAPREQNAAAFVLSCILQDDFVAFTDRTSDGTKMPRTSWTRMAQYCLALPGDRVIEAFDPLVQPMFDRIVSNIHESRTLAATRDLLLPKLMSGEIRVKAAERTVQDTA
jgi:type I restriction enzyme S subunit